MEFMSNKYFSEISYSCNNPNNEFLHFIQKVNNQSTFEVQEEILSMIIVESIDKMWQGIVPNRKRLLPM